MPENKKEPEEELVPVGPGAEVEETGEEEGAGAEKEKKPKAGVEGGEEEDDDEKDDDEKDGEEEAGEERLGHSDEGDDTKEGRRAERKRRKLAQREARDRNQRELNYLRKRNEDLERRFGAEFAKIHERLGQTEVVSVDGRINALKGQLKVADQVIAKAIEKGNGSDAVKAQEIRDEIRDAIGKLSDIRENIQTRAEIEDTPRAELDPTTLNLARQWCGEHDWFTPGGKDKDSRIVTRIDNEVKAEGYDPRDPQYWQEVSRRVEEALPHRFDESDDEELDEGRPARGSNGKEATKQRGGKGGPRFSTGGRERPLKKGEVYVTQDRRKALEELGVWDDSKLRNQYLKSFAKWDRENGSRA